MPRKKNPWSKRICVKHAGVGIVPILCDTDCMYFVNVPMREGKAGGTESHTWRGCVIVLNILAKCVETSGISLDEILSLNR